ncbi:MAG: hypothetical protein BWY65_00985 [Firmicutes bacterium ADurb.Bin373]|nr:MAG: hypothetical protein BWY65_00985 [Firmicutes bacterium ADurb.Bin373]
MILAQSMLKGVNNPVPLTLLFFKHYFHLKEGTSKTSVEFWYVIGQSNIHLRQ